MAMFGPGETPTDEPFTRFAGPMDVASNVQTALSACWQNLPQADRSFSNLSNAAHGALKRAEEWWLNLPDRAGYQIVMRMQEDFRPPASLVEDAKAAMNDPDRTHIDMFKWLPTHEMASAIMSAWMLQPESTRNALGTVSLVRAVLERQLIAAEQDIAAF